MRVRPHSKSGFGGRRVLCVGFFFWVVEEGERGIEFALFERLCFGGKRRL